MISTIEIYKAIREQLEKLFPDVLIQQKDIKNIIRPSFYIQYVGKNFELTAGEFYEDRISFNIIYFAKNEKLLELLEIEETLTRAFKTPLMIPDDKYIIEVKKDAIQSNLNEEDYYLNFTIDFVLYQHMADDETGETIEEIGLKVENENKKTISEYNEEDISDMDI